MAYSILFHIGLFHLIDYIRMPLPYYQGIQVLPLLSKLLMWSMTLISKEIDSKSLLGIESKMSQSQGEHSATGAGWTDNILYIHFTLSTNSAS